jgi:hypothetical protein
MGTVKFGFEHIKFVVQLGSCFSLSNNVELDEYQKYLFNVGIEINIFDKDIN